MHAERDLSTDEELLMQDINTDANNHTPYILAITTSRIACLNGDLSTAEELLTQDINTSPNNHTSYAHRSFVMARKYDWDAPFWTQSRIQPSLTGYISKGIALCGKGRVLDARAAFDVASMYTDQDSEITHFLLLIKAIALFNADQHDEANLLLKSSLPVVRIPILSHAYLHVQLGIKALDGARYDEAADHFTAAIDSSDYHRIDIHEVYEIWWWNAAHSALPMERLPSLQAITTRLLTYTRWRSTWILHPDIFFARRSEAKLSKMLWEDALLDARKVTELNPSSHVGYQLSHSALRGAQRYDEAIEAFTIMLSKLDDAPEVQIRDLRQQYVRPSEAEDAIRRALNSFKTSPEYKELLSSITKRSDLEMERIKEVVATHFRCVLLSHRWEETEVLLHHIQNKDVRELKDLVASRNCSRSAKSLVMRGISGRGWIHAASIRATTRAWRIGPIHVRLVPSLALTIVYLSDVPPSSQPGALRAVFGTSGMDLSRIRRSESR
ncbi:uncharacterized protein HD556DRAFT_1445173 [Suillus plorans]|uniref:Uncharacterized protein n=1 Tax=Suillus plorans TaxID=116603 RepID=A0A9P7ABY3_9AGAM|nr:uncharacterized protein HD556DRAFT_1507336 [Suillus plorans]XP_041158349.1 uncharacterized protein HD556DRAFT_1445173 [Suillus plorans]KAG1786312.1 hypothetical protein HD556DRAFT_1507336 [Suillus plorans]KAG1791543.1 hypothetical protein HD556DRAFT_1445173 [Suillus plorans]